MSISSFIHSFISAIFRGCQKERPWPGEKVQCCWLLYLYFKIWQTFASFCSSAQPVVEDPKHIVKEQIEHGASNKRNTRKKRNRNNVSSTDKTTLLIRLSLLCRRSLGLSYTPSPWMPAEKISNFCSCLLDFWNLIFHETTSIMQLMLIFKWMGYLTKTSSNA